MTDKKPLNFWQIWNMSFGFLGIQFGWALQMANMSAIYEYLGARADQIPILWLAAPLTGLIVQPIIGHSSDRTWNRLGRRRPYFLTGAILSSLALILMPRSSTLWMAAGLLWVMDASINISMEPFRAFVADLLPEDQRTRGFAMQSLFIGLGAVVASALPWLLTNMFHVAAGAPGQIPATVRLSFYMGAVAFFGAVMWTIVTTKEYPPDDLEAFRKMKAEKPAAAATARNTLHGLGGWLILVGLNLLIEPCVLAYTIDRADLGSIKLITTIALIVGLLFLNVLFYQKDKAFPTCYIVYIVLIIVAAALTRSRQVGELIISAVVWIPYFLGSRRVKATFVQRGEILGSIAAMPKTMKQLAWVQIATWMGLFCMWLYFGVAVAHNVFGAPDEKSPLYTQGVEWAGVCFGMYSAVCFVWSFALPLLARKLGRKGTHSFCLLCGAAGLLSVAVIHDKYLLLLSMVGVGIAWASTLAMPYVILAGSLPSDKTGTYMGIFNFFIVIPEITASLGFGWVMNHLLDNNRLLAVVAGGVFFAIAAALMQRVTDVGAVTIEAEPRAISAH